MQHATPPALHVGRDGWLFWRGPKDRALRLHQDTWLARWVAWRWTGVLDRRRRQCHALGARFVQLFAPDKFSVYPDKLDGLRVTRGVGARMAALRPGIVLDLIGPLTEARREGETVLRTDTHWTHRGYLVAYRAVCEALGAPVADTVLDARPGEEVSWLFDLGSKCDPPIREVFAVHALEPRAIRQEANALLLHREALLIEGFAPGLMVGCRWVTRNAWEGADPRRLVIFGDSYAFHRTGLAPMLAESFAEVHFLWSADVDWHYLARVRPDVVIAETAERYAGRVPRDGVDVDAQAQARVSKAQPRP